MTAETAPPEPAAPSKEGVFFRAVIGLMAITGSLAGFLALYFVEVPPGNRDALMFALGIVFGWGSSVINSEYGASNTGRKIAESAIKRADAAAAIADAPPASIPADGGTVDVNVVNPSSKPANVKEAKK